jgi:hypothetical protein
MFARLAVVSVLALQAMVAFAEPIPAPTAAPEVVERGLLDDLTSGAASVFGQFTSGGGDVASFVTSECRNPNFPGA